jgi:DNA-binding beta-propeller fold protein YncE
MTTVTSPRLAAAVSLLFTTTLAIGAQRPPVAAPYRVSQRHALGGTGQWDFVTVDSVGHRLFIARGDRVMISDPTTGRLLGEIGGLHGAQHVAVVTASGHGFITSGDDGKVVMFDLETLKVLARTPAAADADVIVYDPASHRVFSFNGTAKSATAIDPASGARIGTIPLGGSPEFGVADGMGHIYFNVASRDEVAELDTRSMKVTRHWSIAGCKEPSGLALDAVNRRIFSVCSNRRMAVSDAMAGRVVATLPIGGSPDGVVYDPITGDAFSANGEGTVTVVHEDTPARFHVAQTLPTMPGARTIALDPTTHRVYTVANGSGGKGKAVFTLLVIER